MSETSMMGAESLNEGASSDARLTETLWDTVIIGGGHNGLVTAAYLARAGFKVCVLEKRAVLGGAAVTEEFHPGFRNSVASYTVSLLSPKVIKELDLHAHGLEVRERPMSNFWPYSCKPGDYLTFPYGLEAMQAEFTRFSKSDAERLPAYLADTSRAANLLRDLLYVTPPAKGAGLKAVWDMLKLGHQMNRLSSEDQQLLLDLFTVSAVEFLEGYFTHPALIAAFAFDGIVGFYGSPYTPGTAYVLLHHAFGEVNGKQGVWGHAVGGMGAISAATARSARLCGAHLYTDTAVVRVCVEDGKRGGKPKAVGVELASGALVRAKSVACGATPVHLFRDLVCEAVQPPAFSKRMRQYKSGSGVFRMNVALSGLPEFPALGGGTADHLSSGIIIAPTTDYMDRAFRDAQSLGWSREPIVEMLIPSTLDETLAPPGQHVASLFCQQFAYGLPGGKKWQDWENDVADLIIKTVDTYAPGFADSVIARQILSPKGLETKLGLTGGDIFHGRLSLDQLFSARPMIGAGHYRMPVAGLYLCGSGAHPGGGVTGVPGHNAAREIISDRRRLGI